MYFFRLISALAFLAKNIF